MRLIMFKNRAQKQLKKFRAKKYYFFYLYKIGLFSKNYDFTHVTTVRICHNYYIYRIPTKIEILTPYCFKFINKSKNVQNWQF